MDTHGDVRNAVNITNGKPKGKKSICKTKTQKGVRVWGLDLTASE